MVTYKTREECWILRALADEAHDRMFYHCLMELAPNETAEKMIESIRNDEIKHFKMFRAIYEELTCRPFCGISKPEFSEPENYCEALEKALAGELKAVEFYRRIMFGLCTRWQRDMLFEIITDELKHSVKVNFLYTSAHCSCEE